MKVAVHNLINRDSYNNNEILSLVNSSTQRDDVCHICRNTPVTYQKDYGLKGIEKIMRDYFRYRFVYSMEHNGNWRAGDDSLRERLNLPKIGEGWIGETMLFNRVVKLLPNEKVIRQGSPEWLGLQRFDIWIPNLKVAIEYNGRQHFHPVEFFGGQSAFENTIERDARKRKLCEENGVTLLEISYDENTSDEMLLSLIKNKQVLRQN